MFRALSVAVALALAATVAGGTAGAAGPDERHTRVAVVASLFDSPDAAIAARGVIEPELTATPAHIDTEEELVDAHRHGPDGEIVEVYAPVDDSRPSFEMANPDPTTPAPVNTATSVPATTGTSGTATGSTDGPELAPGVVGGLAAPSASLYSEWASGSVGSGTGGVAGTLTNTDAGPIVCPTPGSTFINDWGFGRSGGRTHKGTDMFAPIGNPIVAVQDAWITKVDRTDTYVVGSGRGDLGGISVSYVTDRGDRWYNAHMHSVAPGIEVGVRVTQGQQIGTVGNTGNARTTPPHNHIGWFPGGGEASNPYPVIAPACLGTR